MLQVPGAENYRLAKGDVILVPAEVENFFLFPGDRDTRLLEVRMSPREDNDIVSEPLE